MTGILRMLALAGGVLLLNPSALAQHATGFDVEGGAQAYQRLCANCHGPDGDLIAEIDLGRGLYRRPYTDMELASIILEGIPNTPMPPNPTMSEEQAEELVAYLRYMAESGEALSLAGDAERGRALYQNGDCASCHAISGIGSGLGPELTSIGTQRSQAELLRALLDPELEVRANHRFYQVVTRAGESVRGRLLNQDTFMVLLLDEQETLRSFDKASLREHGFVPPAMPSLRGVLSEQEIADLVAYLSSLRG